MSIAELRQECFSTNSHRVIVKAFRKLLVSGFNKVELAMAAWEFANEFKKQGQDLHKIVRLCNLSNRIFTDVLKNISIPERRKYALVLGRIYHLLGCSYHQLQRFPESLKCLNAVVARLTIHLQDEGDDGSNVLADVHFELSRVQRAMGLIDDAGYNLRKGLAFNRGIISDEIGKAIQQVADECMKADNFTDALSFYLKAGEMYMKQVRPDQELLKEVRTSMALAYAELGDLEEAIKVSGLTFYGLKALVYASRVKRR